MAGLGGEKARAALGAFAISLAVFGCAPDYPPPPDTLEDPVVDVIHGIEFVDDYRWLEDQGADATRAWIATQNAYAEQIVGESLLRDRLRERLRELMDVPDVGQVRRAGEFEYFTMRAMGQEAPVLYRRPASEEDQDEPELDREYEVVLDPVDFDPGYRTLPAAVDFSPDGSLMLYSIRDGGSDEVEIRVRDLEAGSDLPDRLPRALYGGVGFTGDGSGFHYTYRSRETGPRIRRHTLGEDFANDELIFGEAYGPTTFVGMNVVDDGRFRIFTAQHGWASIDVFIEDMTDTLGPRPVVVGEEARSYPRFHDGNVYLRTNLDAPMNRLVRFDPRRPGQEDWVEVIPEADVVLQDFTFIDDRIYATYLEDVSDRILVFGLDGTPEGEIEVPDYTSAGISGSGDGKAVLTLNAHLTPRTTYEIDLQSGERTVLEESGVPFDPSGFAVSQIWYSSSDGARAPIYVLHAEDIVLDGSHPLLLTGYGGFNSSQKPGFSTTAAVWLESGGVYAVATLRGGSEFGEEWHRDGMLENKQQVFDDFIAAAEWLIATGYARPERLAISGGSNGGLLVASAFTQRPELYRAVLCTYPDLDMVRFFEFTETNNMPALLEYGDASDPDQFEFIRQYSPYQAVRDGVDYPAVMLTTGDLDTRVPPLQARRMAARLQHASGSGLPVILHYDEKGGHAAGRGRPLSLRVEDSARELAFLMQQLGMDSGDEG